MSETLELLASAVRQKKQVLCDYQGYPRQLCVHAVGWKNGREQAMAFQFAGESSKGLPPGGQWRCMKVEEIENATLHDGEWHSSDDHSKPQTCVDEILAEVDY